MQPVPVFFTRVLLPNIYKQQRHPFHLVNKSPWPILVSLATLVVTAGGVLYMHRYTGSTLWLFWGLICLILCIWWWFRDIIKEATFEGKHTKRVRAGLRFGMKLFIITEIMFFFSFFWAFFHSALAPHTFIGGMWPPKEIIPSYIEVSHILDQLDIREEKNEITEELVPVPSWVKIKACLNLPVDFGERWAICAKPFFDPYNIPLAATFVLLSSGVTLHIAGMWFNLAEQKAKYPFDKEDRDTLITYWRFRLEFNKKQWPSYHFGYVKRVFETAYRPNISNYIKTWLWITIFLGCFFTYIQAYEYIVLLPFSINDSVFGTCFYMLTGFHGFHVILGTIGLWICVKRQKKNHFTKTTHVGFECASWYWHFVDGVWLFVYTIVYWWSAPLEIPIVWMDNNMEIFSCYEAKQQPWSTVQRSFESEEEPKLNIIKNKTYDNAIIEWLAHWCGYTTADTFGYMLAEKLVQPTIVQHQWPSPWRQYIK